MASQTSRLKLTEQANSENWSNDIHNANLEKIESAIIRTTSNNITGVSGANNSAFIVNLMQRLASTYDFSALQFGDVIAGRAEWAGVDYVHFTATKVTGTTWNVFVTAGSRIVTAYYNASSGTVTSITDVINKIATELASKQYVFSTNSASTFAEQVLAFCENHRGESNYTASFFMSASNAPSDLPANTNAWKYAFGEVRIRISPLSGGIDGVIILYAFSANQMALRYIANSVVSNEWKVFS